MNALYESIKKLCDEREIKPGKMCAEIGISRGLISDLKSERTKSITSETAQKIADYFGVTVDRVLGTEQKENPVTTISNEVIPGYSDLDEENKAKAKEYIAFLLSLQQKD